MIDADLWPNVARLFALVSILFAVGVFATGSKWWRNRSLRATFYLFMSILLVLLHGLIAGNDLYPIEWRPTVTVAQWGLIGLVFLWWSISFIREQFRPHPAGEVTQNRRVGDPGYTGPGVTLAKTADGGPDTDD